MENLYDHICFLEGRVMSATDIQLTHELHVIRANQLHYTSLLDDYAQHVKFIMETSNPMLNNPKFTDEDREYSRDTMDTECHNLILEIERLKNALQMQQRRLTNVMGLVFSSVNIQDSRYMGELTASNLKDSTTMKQISYLAVGFLPASFAANFFGMNVLELSPGTSGSLGRYFAIALPLTAITAWIVIAFQSEGVLPEESNRYKRLAWPAFLILKKMKEKRAMMSKSGVGVNEDIPQLQSIVDFLDEDEDDTKSQQFERVLTDL